MSRYHKMIPPLLGGVVMVILTTILNARADNHVDASEWVQVVIQVFMVITVWGAANVPGFEKAKTFMAAVAVVLNLLVTMIIGGVDGTEWMNLAIAFLSAVGVAAAPPNSPPPLPAARATL